MTSLECVRHVHVGRRQRAAAAAVVPRHDVGDWSLPARRPPHHAAHLAVVKHHLHATHSPVARRREAALVVVEERRHVRHVTVCEHPDVVDYEQQIGREQKQAATDAAEPETRVVGAGGLADDEDDAADELGREYLSVGASVRVAQPPQPVVAVAQLPRPRPRTRAVVARRQQQHVVEVGHLRSVQAVRHHTPSARREGERVLVGVLVAGVEVFPRHAHGVRAAGRVHAVVHRPTVQLARLDGQERRRGRRDGGGPVRHHAPVAEVVQLRLSGTRQVALMYVYIGTISVNKLVVYALRHGFGSFVSYGIADDTT